MGGGGSASRCLHERAKETRKRRRRGEESSSRRKRPRTGALAEEEEEEVAEVGGDYFDGLPDDLVVSILCKLSSSAAFPSDLIYALLTCKRFKGLVLHPLVLCNASKRCLAVRAKNWSDSVHRFLKRCVDAGNLEACYILGMIRFYCLQSRGSGASLMARAAIGSHAAALYSLGVIQFNGSGGTKNDKDLRAGVALCARAAFLGHMDALRELGHCLQDGYGVRRNVAEGRRFLVQANARELAAVLSSADAAAKLLRWRQFRCESKREVAWSLPLPLLKECPLLSDYGLSLTAPEPHPANRFLVEWFAERGFPAVADGLRVCCHGACGRPETRRHEFRRCSVCGTVNYCSRACQALDWKLFHKAKCVPVDNWLLGAGNGGAAAAAENGGAGPVDAVAGDVME